MPLARPAQACTIGDNVDDTRIIAQDWRGRIDHAFRCEHGPVTGLIDRIRGVWVAALAAVSATYGWFIIAGLPHWANMEAAQGAPDLQTRFFYHADEAARALGAIDASAQQDALIFYALDVPNALLYGLSIAALTAWGLRQVGLSARLSWLTLLAPIAALADLIENGCLTAALLTTPDKPTILGSIAGIATGTKLGLGAASQIAAVIMVLIGGAAWLGTRIRPSARPSSS